MNYAISMTFRMDNKPYNVLIYNVNDSTITESSTINMNPLVNGDMAGDHMYNEPDTLSINGTFSQNATNVGIVINNVSPTFVEIQRFFKKLRKQGILCDIVKCKVNSSSGSIGFDVRKNMVLDRCTWTEGINTLGFNMDFTQILYSNIQTYEVTIDDQFVPNITGLKQVNFTSDLLDWSVVDQILYSALIENKLIDQAFLQYLQTVAATTAVGVGIAIAVIAALGASGPVGWAILAVGAVVGICVGIVKAIVDAVNSRKYRIQQFKYYDDDKKNQQEVERFAEFVGSIHQQLQKLNDNILSYKIVSNEDQEATLAIDENYYIFKFTKNQIVQSAELAIFDVDGNRIAGHPNIRTCQYDFFQCNTYNSLFRVPGSGAYVYLMKTANQDADLSDLTNYYVVVSKINPAEITSAIEEIIMNALLR